MPPAVGLDKLIAQTQGRNAKKNDIDDFEQFQSELKQHFRPFQGFITPKMGSLERKMTLTKSENLFETLEHSSYLTKLDLAFQYPNKPISLRNSKIDFKQLLQITPALQLHNHVLK